MKKNVMFIIPSLSGGGAEKTVINLSDILKEKYNIYIVTFEKKIIIEKKLHDIQIIDLELTYTKMPIKKIINTIKKIRKIKRIKKNNNIYCSISFLKRPSLINVLSKYNEKTIVSFRNKMSEQDKSIISKIITKLIAHKADSIVSLSKMVKYDLINKYNIKKDKIKVIYNPCDIKYIEEMKSEKIDSSFLNKVKNKKIIINVGRLNKQKGQDKLIYGFNEYQKKEPNSLLLILGKGEEEDNLNKIINELGLNNKVLLLGFHKNPYKYMRIADVFVFSSNYEGLGNALLEAAGAGLPIISTDCKYGPKEILSPESNLFEQVKNIEICKYGILIPAIKNTNQKYIQFLSKAIEMVLDNKELRDQLKKQSIKRAMDFDPETIKKEWINVIE